MTIQNEHRFFAANALGQEIATCVVRLRQPPGFPQGVRFLTDVWVHEDHRGKGLAREAINQAVATYGHEDLWLLVSGFGDRPRSDVELAEWYARWGFELVPNVPSMMRRPAGTTRLSDPPTSEGLTEIDQPNPTEDRQVSSASPAAGSVDAHSIRADSMA